MVKVHVFENGLRLIVQEMTGIMSVTMGILVGAGGAYENDSEDGISHYIEHMQFKGTPTYNAQQLSEAFDDIGAQVNAFTGKDVTCYYSKSTAKRAGEAFDILSDLFLNATYPEDEAVKEKEVICEEISMSEDTPDDVCLELLSTAMYGKEGYGRNILGPAENVRGFTKEMVDNYKARLYRPENMVVSFAGAIAFDDAQKMVEKHFAKLEGGKFTPQRKTLDSQTSQLYKNKPIEQVHLALGFSGYARGDERLEALQLANTILGSGMSSRLFQTVREQMGLAYSVYSYPTAYNECGQVTVYAGVNPKNAGLAFDAIRKVLDEVVEKGVTEQEFLRGKEQLRASNTFAQESTASQMLWYGKGLLHENRVDSYEDALERLEKITLADVNAVLKECFGVQEYSTAIVGNIDKPLEVK